MTEAVASAGEKNRSTGWALAAAGMLFVSTDSLFIRLAETSTWNIAFVVACFSLPILLGLAWRFDDRASWTNIRRDARPLVLVGLLASVSQIAFIGAVKQTAVANVVTIVASAPIIAAVIAWLILGEQTTRRVWNAIGITVIGIAVVVLGSLGQPSLDGDLLALLAILAFGASINVWRRNPDMSVFLGLALSTTTMLAISAFLVDLAVVDTRALLAAIGMGAVFNPLGRICHASSPRYAPAAEVALFTPVETVAAPIWAWLAFREAPPLQTFIGAVIIVLGVLYGTVLPSLLRRSPA